MGGEMFTFRIICQLLGSAIYSTMVFWSMYMDYFRGNSIYYFITVLFPLMYVRTFRYLVISILLSCIVSSILVDYFIPPTETYFLPFDGMRSTLVVLESIFFGMIQGCLLFMIKNLIRYINNGKNVK